MITDPNARVQLVGRAIRKLRKDRKLTQTELSARVGIQQSDLSRMEQGHYRVSLDTLFRILAEFDLGVGEFFNEVNAETFTPRDVELVRQFRSLRDHDQREVRELIAHKRQPGERQRAAR